MQDEAGLPRHRSGTADLNDAHVAEGYGAGLSLIAFDSHSLASLEVSRRRRPTRDSIIVQGKQA